MKTLLEKEKTMKKRIHLLVTILFLIVGCDPKYDNLIDYKDSLSDSMKVYYNLNSKSYSDRMFEAKVLDLVEIIHPFSKNDNLKTYRYRIIVAPWLYAKIKMKSIQIKPIDRNIFEYLNGEVVITSGQLNSSKLSGLSVIEWKELSDYRAYEFSVTINNLTDSFQKEKGIEDSKLREALQNIQLVIEYNNRKENIELTDIPLLKVTEEMLETREDLRELLENGATRSSYTPYGLE